MKKLFLLVALALCVAFAGTAAAATTATGTLTGTATLSAAGACTVVGGGGSFNFGTITPPIAADIDTTGSFQINCPINTPYDIALSAGNSGINGLRQMVEATDQTNRLIYNLYTDAARTTIWGNGAAPTATVPGNGSGTDQSISVYARLPAQNTSFAGTYTDVVTITVTY